MKSSKKHNTTPRPRRQRQSSYDRKSQKLLGAGGYDVSKACKSMDSLLVFFLIIFAIIVIRLFSVQIFNASFYANEARHNRVRQQVIYAKRGTIYDRNGNVIAYSEDAKAVCCNPSQITSKEAYAKILAARLGKDPSDYLKILKSNKTFAYINRQVDTKTAEKLLKDFTDAGLPGIYLEQSQMRVYPYHEVGCQVLGLVNIDGDGVSGIEKQYDSILKGENGSQAIAMGVNGTPIAGGEHKIVEAKDGQDIVLSLDINVQAAAEANIVEAQKEYKSESGSIIALDPKTGGIIAMCSTPLADFSDLSGLTNESLQLKPISASYEPGSIFKPVTMAIALDADVVTPHSTFTVPPTRKVGDDTVSDVHKRKGNVVMDCTEMMRQSSNVGFSIVGEKVGKEKISEGLKKFGIGEKTGVDFPGEAQGIVPDIKNYTGATVGSMSFGQGLAIPLLQTTRATAALANGGVMYTPHFLVQKGDQKVSWPEGKRVVSEKTADEITEMLRVVVQNGTGIGARIDRFDVAGKTGTAEMASSEGGYRKNKYVSSFIGYANAKNPSVVVCVSLNGTSSLAGGSAAPAFSGVMKEALVDLGTKAAY